LYVLDEEIQYPKWMNKVKDSAHSGYLVLVDHMSLPVTAMIGQQSWDLGLFLAHHILATVVTALRAYGVINMPCATV
jgi:hypothetical protein